MNSDVFEILNSHHLTDDAHEHITDINNVSPADVQRELGSNCGKFSLNRLKILLSPAAGEFIEEMAQQARRLTIQRFGRTMQLYAPLYVSSYCINSCRYCGFNIKTDMDRARLSIEQAMADAEIIAAEGFRNILLVSGEDPFFVTTDYLGKLAERLKDKFSTISMEIYPMSQADYKKCFDAGIDGVTLYQETYNKKAYEHYHPAGPKSSYEMRLNAHDRTAGAGMRRLGLGFLLGLCDWRGETLAMAVHANYLMKKYWRSQVSFSFPRIRPAAGEDCEYEHLVSDHQLVQMMCALRLCFADAGIVLSTRESAEFRDNMMNICVTQVSAGSKTNPGGYSDQEETLEQFSIDDDRSPAEIAEIIRQNGYEVVHKDWDKAFGSK